MARAPRICFDGALYHVTCRGDNREPIFLDDQDYQQYLLFLRRYKDQFGFLLYGYCLMPNHVHLVIEPSLSGTISKIMLCANTRYTQYFNRRYGRVGHLFQGRFHSRLIEKDAYLLAASRYVHLNPVAAHLCRRPDDYPWSSYQAYVRGDDPLRLIDRECVLGLLGVQAGNERQAYKEFVESKLVESAAQAHLWMQES